MDTLNKETYTFGLHLSILIVAAVIQGEFYERRFGGGPPHLDMSLAMPQGIRRGAITLGLAIGFGWAIDTALPWGYTLSNRYVFAMGNLRSIQNNSSSKSRTTRHGFGLIT